MSLIKAKSFPGMLTSTVVSRDTLDEHYKLYLSYIAKCNELTDRLTRVQCCCSTSQAIDITNLKGDLTFVISAIRNHECYFDVLGHQITQPTGPLIDAINSCFGNLDNYIADLRHTARISRGWTWTLMDHTSGRLWNLPGQQVSLSPLWNAQPLLALDLYEHAFFYDYGHRRSEYIDALIAHLDWKPAEARYLASIR